MDADQALCTAKRRVAAWSFAVLVLLSASVFLLRPHSLQDDLVSKVKSLEDEVGLLRQAVAIQRSSAAAVAHRRLHGSESAIHVDPIVPIDLQQMLGTEDFYDGISFDVHVCASPLPTVFPNMGDATLQLIAARWAAELGSLMAEILGKDKPVAPESSWLAEIAAERGLEHGPRAEAAMVRDPRTKKWREVLAASMARYLVLPNNSRALVCPDQRGTGGTPITSIKQLLLDDDFQEPPASGTGSSSAAPAAVAHKQLPDVCPGMSTAEVAGWVGYHAMPHIPLTTLTRDALKWGVCTKPPEQQRSFGEWLREERMHTPAWRTYAVEGEDADHVVFLYDMLYEKLGVFKRQYWLGVITMQNPFDMMSISDIIYTVKPDLIIETGTANGGSALLWASLLHLSGVPNGRVVTVDLAPPVWDPQQQHWGGTAREDPTKHPLWKKHVTFIQGDAADPEVFGKVQAAAAAAKRVLVLLDSAHESSHVEKELATFCPLTTVGSYCIVEDTKMSRWASDGPLTAVRAFMAPRGAGHGKFTTDRDRELLYTHHAMGYLRRVK